MTTMTGTTTKERIITESEIGRYEQALRESEHAPATVEKYTAALRKLMAYLDVKILATSGQRSCNTRTAIPEISGQAFL